MVAAAPHALYASVPQLWPQSTIVCLGTGPSLTAADVDYCRDRARVIAIKDAVRLAPWADVLYSCGSDRGRWYQRNADLARAFPGRKYTLDPAAIHVGAEILRVAGFTGLCASPDGLCTGKNSGYQAINLSVHLGASRIVLLGYDMEADAKDRDHFFGQHWHGARVPFLAFRELFATLLEPLRARGVQVINASRQTALTCFDRMSLVEALA